jgi:hypothetical protein
MCSDAFGRYLQCILDNGWTCSSSGPQSPMACQPLALEVMRCAGGEPPPPPPPVDGGTVEPVYPGCPQACAQANMACRTMDATCVSECSRSVSLAPGCLRVFDRVLACLGREGFTCPRGEPTPSTRCDSVIAEFEMCAMSSGGGGETPPPPMTRDAGAAPPPDV